MLNQPHGIRGTPLLTFTALDLPAFLFNDPLFEEFTWWSEQQREQIRTGTALVDGIHQPALAEMRRPGGTGETTGTAPPTLRSRVHPRARIAEVSARGRPGLTTARSDVGYRTRRIRLMDG
ncbi:hypothetical protein [Streptomyces cyanogenus]|uniref:hypothetical protein n=1 Tax=Streptomyces cyanogenus TaxID=80860 RepID=UPI001AA190B2|nr:hypothetical protein [Streptomyces cyanogenus]